MHNPFLIGERIYLRALERGDAATLLPWINDTEVNRFTRQYLPRNLQFEEEFIDKVSRDERGVVCGIVLKENDQLVGVAGLMEIDLRTRQAGFGITIGVKEHWNQGHGTETTRLVVRYAFETLNLNRVWLHVYEFNPRGLRAYEKVGFQREGLLRQATYRDGRFWDVIAMALLRKEWHAGTP